MDYTELQRLADDKSTISYVPDEYGRNRGDFIIDNPVYIYRSNFGGELRKTRDGRVVNSAGNRNFNVVVPSQYVDDLANHGYRVKVMYNKDEAGRELTEDGPVYMLNIKVKYTDPKLNEKAAHYNSLIYRLSETNGFKRSQKLEYFQDPTEGVGILDDDSNGKKLNGAGMIHVSSYLHPSKDDPNVMVNTPSVKKAAIVIETLDDPFAAYSDYFYPSSSGEVADMGDEDELPFD